VLRVGVATKAKTPGERKPSHLVFLVDVSGSMASPDKLELAKQALGILTDNLTEKDSVSIVTYAGDTRLVLPMTSIDHKDKIHAAIQSLHAGGSTAMASGIDLAYEQAIRTVSTGTISRVIVCTDGDANVGAHSSNELLNIIASRAKQGVTLSTIGFGMGNYKDAMMEQLADKGNGNNYYIDSLTMAKRVFADQLTSTIEVAAKDVKLQVDFDPAHVSRYRLLGYENRDIADKDFRNDRVGAGQVGWGHQVTALYELELADGPAAPLGLVRLRHKAPSFGGTLGPGSGPSLLRGGRADDPSPSGPDGDTSVEETFAMAAPPAHELASASPDLRFAFAVAAFADVMRGGATWSLDEIRELAATATTDNDRHELLGLIDRARSLRGKTATVAQ
jgi:Ca-activated chloride channel family protein